MSSKCYYSTSVAQKGLQSEVSQTLVGNEKKTHNLSATTCRIRPPHIPYLVSTRFTPNRSGLKLRNQNRSESDSPQIRWGHTENTHPKVPSIGGPERKHLKLPFLFLKPSSWAWTLSSDFSTHIHDQRVKSKSLLRSSQTGMIQLGKEIH